MTLKTTSTLALITLALALLQACSTTAVASKAVEMRAANEHDCHLNEVVIVPVKDKDGIWRATGCGHETFWVCREDRYGGPDLCDRVAFPEDSKLLRF